MNQLIIIRWDDATYKNWHPYVSYSRTDKHHPGNKSTEKASASYENLRRLNPRSKILVSFYRGAMDSILTGPNTGQNIAVAQLQSISDIC